MFLLFKVQKGEILNYNNLNINYIDTFKTYKLAQQFIQSDQNLKKQLTDEKETAEFIIIPEKFIFFVKPARVKNTIINLNKIRKTTNE